MQTPMRREFVLVNLLIPVLLGASIMQAQSATPQNAPKPEPNPVTEIDAGLGPCSAGFTVNDSAGQPVYNAKIRLHIEYGKFNFHKLDLEAGTNAAGKARFIGLPDKSKEGLFFRA